MCSPNKEQLSDGGGQSKVPSNGSDEHEVYYRTMSEKHYKRLVKTSRMLGTGEICLSPTEDYFKGYDGVLVEFEVKHGTKAMLKDIGVRDKTKFMERLYTNMKDVTEVANDHRIR